VGIWIATFALAYLARIASEGAPVRVAGDRPRSPVVSDVPDTGTVCAISGRDAAVTAVGARIAEEPLALLGPSIPAESEVATASVEVTTAPAEAVREVWELVAIAPEEPIAARRTIFDDADLAADDIDPDTFGLDLVDDVDEIDVEPVLSLDEEFSRLAMEAEDATDLEPMAVAEHPTVAEMMAAAPATVAETIPDSRAVTGKSTMHHTIAVIVSRGADF
jgi:hypothetical protein